MLLLLQRNKEEYGGNGGMQCNKKQIPLDIAGISKVTARFLRLEYSSILNIEEICRKCFRTESLSRPVRCQDPGKAKLHVRTT